MNHLVFGGLGDLGQKRLRKAFETNGVGADCVDVWSVGNEPAHKSWPFGEVFHALRDRGHWSRRLRDGYYDSAYIATPPAVTGRYHVEMLHTKVKQVVTEKPFFSCLNAARRSRAALENSLVVSRHVDHYGYKSVVRWLSEQPLGFWLGGGPTDVSGWLLEESAAVSRGQQVGSLADQLTHLVTVTRMIFPGYAVDIKDAFAARYFGCSYNAETYCFVEAKVAAADVRLVAAKGFPFKGKGFLIEGPVASLLIDMEANRAELVTKSVGEPEKIRVVYQASEKTEDPYQEIVRRFAKGDQYLGMSFEESVAILEILDRARRFFPTSLPRYLFYPTSWKTIEHHFRAA